MSQSQGSHDSSLIKQHLVPPESIENLKRQFYKEDQRKWLRNHSTTVSKNVTKKHTNRTYYQNLVKSLRNEDDPKAAAMALIESNSHIQHVPEDVDEESVAGKVVKQELQQEYSLSPLKSFVSPGVVLTERRRKMIIEKLQNGGFDENSPLFAEQDVSLSTETFGDHSRLNYDVAIKKSEIGPFEPKWDHYNTMRMRWRYIRPQAQLLISEEHMMAPKQNTYVMKSAAGEKIQGNYVEVVDFNTKRATSASYGKKNRASPYNTTGASYEQDIYRNIATRKFREGDTAILPPRPKKKY